MRTAIGRAVLVGTLLLPAIGVAQRVPKKSTPANFSIVATDLNGLTGEVYNVTGTFSTAGPLKPGVEVTNWNISGGPHNFSNLESPWSNARVFLAVSSSTTIAGDDYPGFASGGCSVMPDNLRIQFFNYLTGYLFTAYVPTDKLSGPGTQAALSISENCLYFGAQEYTSTRLSGLDSMTADPGWDHSTFIESRTCILYESGSEFCGPPEGSAANPPGNYAEGTITQF